MYKEIFVTLYPYLGCSKTLIEFFAVIGYDEKMIKENCNIQENQKNFKLSIISSVFSESFQNKVNFEDLIKKVYPDKPNIIQTTKTGLAKPKTSNVIFSSCIDSLKGDKKICYSCYALRFYEKYVDNNKIEYYVPKAFLFYSQYPYFTTFYNLSYKLLIYKEYYMEEQIPIEILIYCLVNYIPNPIKNDIIIKDFNPNISIPKLSAYPYIDFDFCQIFNTIPIKEFIKIYILVSLELDILFFSPDLEKLNLFMYMLYIMNYPLTDSNYFWHIRSFSKKDLNYGDEIVGTIFIGINSDFSPNINLKSFRNINYVIDMENKNRIINNISQSEESKELNRLLTYIHNILNHKEKKSSFLLQPLLDLKHKLKRIKKEYDSKVMKNNFDSFFKVDEKIIQINRQIQEAFYDFVLTFLILFKNDYLYDYSSLKIVKNKNNQNTNLTEEENIFLKYFRYTTKYSAYFDNFISYFNTFNEFKISLLITDEFVNLKQNHMDEDSKENNIQYFELMDKLYYSETKKFDINFNDLNKEFVLANERNFICKLEKKEKNQLFMLDKDIIFKFLFFKKKKELFKSFEMRHEEFGLISIKLINISIKIQNAFNQFLNTKYFILGSLIYVFSIIFPLFSFNDNILFLSNLLIRLQKIKYFQRFYANILLKSISKYYLINQGALYFPQLTFENIKNFFELIKGHLIKNFILPNEEIFTFFQNLINEEKNLKDYNKKDKDNSSNNNKFIYQYDNEKKNINSIKGDIIIKKDDKLIYNFKGDKKECDFKKSKFIFQEIFSYYRDYSVKFNYNVECIHAKEMIEIIINIIYFIIQFNDLEMSCFLLNAIDLLEKFQSQIKEFKEKNKDNNLKDKDNNYNNSNENINKINEDNI